MLEISPAKVGHIIIKAREYDAKTGSWEGGGSTAEGVDSDSILEALTHDPTRVELREFIAGLNEDEQAHLVALVWVGRGSYSREEYEEAVETARQERTNPTETYLMGIPLLADYLEEGLEKLGFTVDEIEDDVL